MALGFGKGQLVPFTLMGETAVCQPVWPGGEDGSMETGSDFIGVERDDEIPAPEPQGSQGGTGGGDISGVIAMGKGMGDPALGEGMEMGAHVRGLSMEK